MTAHKQKHIAIIGGGPAGLAMARILQLGDKTNHYDIKVYERDLNAHVRIQGGSLDLHEDSGQIFIDKAELRSEYDKVARVDGGYYSVYTQHHEKVWGMAVPQHPEMDRNDLRTLFVNSLKPETVAWNKHLINIEPHGDNDKKDGYILYFKDQPTTPVYCDAIIGADGANSKVRKYIAPQIPLTYSGVTVIQGDLFHPQEQCPQLWRELRQANMWVFGTGGRSLGFQQKGDGSIIYFLTLRADDEDWIEKTHGVDYTTKDKQAFIQAALSICDGYDKIYLDAIKSTDKFMLRKAYGLMYRSTLDVRWNDFQQQQQQRPAITLIGDAAHVIPFFGGAGANNALMDTVELAEELYENKKDHPDLLSVFTAYEKRMIERCLSAAEFTDIMEQHFHDPEDNMRAVTKAFMGFAPLELEEGWEHLKD